MNPKNNVIEESLLLLEEQKQEWDTLRNGYQSFSQVKKKIIPFPAFSFIVQYNPIRITSTSAKTDAASIQNRKCFLCEENRPKEQRSVHVNSKGTDNKDYYILANPYPLLPQHFTITAKEHIAQRIKEKFGTLLYFAKILSDGLTVFYNGPECGASAPDHLHFQAGTKNYMPLEKEINDIRASYGKILYSGNEVTINAIDDGLRRMIEIKGDKENKISDAFNLFYNVYAQHDNSSEPKMNIIAPYNNGWDLLIMLREKHRPEEFFNETDPLVFSPAGADYAGVCVTPLEKDFNRMDETLLRRVFNQVTLEQKKFNEIADKLSYSLNHS